MPIVTAPFIDSLLTIPSLPSHQWYHTAAAALSVLNLPEEIPLIYAYALEHCAIPGSDAAAYVAEERLWLARNGPDSERVGRIDEKTGKESALRILRRIREGLVKSGGVAGLPKAFPTISCQYCFSAIAKLRR